jgi:hypothetical protein
MERRMAVVATSWCSLDQGVGAAGVDRAMRRDGMPPDATRGRPRRAGPASARSPGIRPGRMDSGDGSRSRSAA